jgi:phenylpropionate dioxygenase-like ring-hydroxylating dioxygenase large terminal subunit
MQSGSYLRNAWYVALWSQDLAPGAVAARTILGEPIALYRGHDGAVAALVDRCPHRFAPLSMGQVLPNGRLRCGYHGLEFDAGGRCVHNPHGNQKIPPAARVSPYPAAERHSLIWVWMGDEPADPALIPDFSILDRYSGDNVTRRDWIRIEASYELITDNLLDLSHTSFLHDGILGNEDTIPAETEVRQDGTTLYVTRWMRNVRPPGVFDLMLRGDGERVDLWFTMRWTPPGYLLVDAGVHEVGRSPESGTNILGVHLLTPETPLTTCYHFVAVRPGNVGNDDQSTAVRDAISALRRKAFADQDKPMIEAQQRNMLRTAERLAPTLLSVDVGPVRYKKILAGLIEAERNANTVNR